MKLTKAFSNKTVNIKVGKKPIDWNKGSRSIGQKMLKDFLRKYWENKYVCAEEWRIPGSLLKFDIVNFNKYLIIEFDGLQHVGFSKFFHKNRLGYIKSIKRDCLKEEWAEKNGFTLIRITEEDLNKLSLEFFKERFNVYLL